MKVNAGNPQNTLLARERVLMDAGGPRRMDPKVRLLFFPSHLTSILDRSMTKGLLYLKRNVFLHVSPSFSPDKCLTQICAIMLHRGLSPAQDTAFKGSLQINQPSLAHFIQGANALWH